MKARVPLGVPWWRLWALQGSFNPRRLQALGWWLILARAWQARGHGADELGRRLAREPESPNTNPYLAGLVFGAVLRLDDAGDSERARSLAQGLSRALGGIGDRATWTAARPVLGLSVLLMAAMWNPWAALALALVFAVLQAWLRWRCLLEGYRRGEEVLALLESPRLHEWLRAAERLAALLAGAVSVQMLWEGSGGTGLSALSDPTGAAVVLVGGALLSWRRAAPELWLVALMVISAWREWSA